MTAFMTLLHPKLGEIATKVVILVSGRIPQHNLNSFNKE